jgi:hypothetical protein
MIDENDYQNLKDEVRSIRGRLSSDRNVLFQEIENLKAKARRNDEAQQFRDYREAVLRIHEGAQALAVGDRYEVWCATCGRSLGGGDTPLAAWCKATARMCKDMCAPIKSVPAETLVDSDFVVTRAGYGSLGKSVVLAQVVPASIYSPKTILTEMVLSGSVSPFICGGKKYHVTITEVPE